MIRKVRDPCETTDAGLEKRVTHAIKPIFLLGILGSIFGTQRIIQPDFITNEEIQRRFLPRQLLTVVEDFEYHEIAISVKW